MEEKSNRRRPNRQKDQTPEARPRNRQSTDSRRRVQCDSMIRCRPWLAERKTMWRGYRPRPTALCGDETSGVGESSLSLDVSPTGTGPANCQSQEGMSRREAWTTSVRSSSEGNNPESAPGRNTPGRLPWEQGLGVRRKGMEAT